MQKRRRRDRRFHPGMYVRIMEDCRKGHPETGSEAIYEGRFDLVTGRRYRGSRAKGIPRLRLPDGNVLWGFDCWWLPESEFRASFNDPPTGVKSLDDWRRALTKNVLSQGQRFPDPAADDLQSLAEGLPPFPPGLQIPSEESTCLT